jgi:hypothetical protein
VLLSLRDNDKFRRNELSALAIAVTSMWHDHLAECAPGRSPQTVKQMDFLTARSFDIFVSSISQAVVEGVETPRATCVQWSVKTRKLAWEELEGRCVALHGTSEMHKPSIPTYGSGYTSLVHVSLWSVMEQILL